MKHTMYIKPITGDSIALTIEGITDKDKEQIKMEITSLLKHGYGCVIIKDHIIGCEALNKSYIWFT